MQPCRTAYSNEIYRSSHVGSVTHGRRAYQNSTGVYDKANSNITSTHLSKEKAKTKSKQGIP